MPVMSSAVIEVNANRNYVRIYFRLMNVGGCGGHCNETSLRECEK